MKEQQAFWAQDYTKDYIQKNRLLKRDFGKLFLENFSAELIDYGFLWGHIYDNAGFDDITWWVFEKKIVRKIKSRSSDQSAIRHSKD